MTAGATKGGYIPSLDGLRAISIALVFLSHAGVSAAIPGGFGVTIFFFLSGYLITSLLVQEYQTHNSIAIKAFYLRRLVRLAPPLLVTLVVAAALVLLSVAEGDLSPPAIASQIFFYYNYYSFFVADFGNNVDGLGILWSLAVEEHFYLVYPWIFIWLTQTRIGLRRIATVLVAILVWRMVRFYGFGDTEWDIYVRSDTRLDSILYGCLLAIMAAQGKSSTWLPNKFMYPILAVSLLALVMTFLVRDPAFRSTVRYSVQGLALIPVFHYAITRHDLWLFKPLNWKPVRRLGQYSYTFYLIHFVIIKAMIFNDLFVDNMILFVLTSGILSIVYSAFVFEVFEKPFKPLRQRLTGH